MQGNPRKIPCISLDSFGRIRTFQGVTAKKIEKTSADQNSRLGLYFALTDRRLKTVIFL
jgi:hypothetical protein